MNVGQPYSPVELAVTGLVATGATQAKEFMKSWYCGAEDMVPQMASIKMDETFGPHRYQMGDCRPLPQPSWQNKSILFGSVPMG